METYSFKAKECLGRISKYNLNIYICILRFKLNLFHIVEGVKNVGSRFYNYF